MKSIFCRSARGFVADDIEEFKDRLRIIRPILAVRSARRFHDFVAHDGAEEMHQRLMSSLGGMNHVQSACFSLRTEALLDHIRDEHGERYYERQQTALSRGRKELSGYDWDQLKRGLNASMKEAATHISMLYEAVCDVPSPRILPAGVVFEARRL